MEQDQIWDLIAKKLSDESTPEELRELEAVLRKNPDLHYSMQTIIDLWHPEEYPDQQEAHQAFNRHVEKMRDLDIDFPPKYRDDWEYGSEVIMPNKNKKALLWSGMIFTVLAAIVFFGFKLFLPDTPLPVNSLAKQASRAISEVSTKNGSKTNLILPDGTKVWLNAGSSITYDSAYGRSVREVSLSGEAFFDVVKNKEKPFLIHASKINIKVLGTEFNVRSYPTDKTTEASLIRGSIEVTFKDKPDKKVILKPNEKIVVENNYRKIENLVMPIYQNKNRRRNDTDDVAVKNLTYEHKTGTVIETSWVDNNLIFQDESFEDIARQLERWYGVSIKFENRQLKENHLTGSFKNETIRQALDALKFTASFNYTIDNNNNITIF